MELLPEIEVWYALPAIRRKVALTMKRQGVPQQEIAKKLGIAASAVSQYITGKRGGTELPKELDKEFDKAAENIIKGDEQNMKKEIMRLNELLKKKRYICDIHRQHSKGVPKKCKVCFE